MKQISEPFPPLPGEIDLIAVMWGITPEKAEERWEFQNQVCQFWEDDEHEVKAMPINGGTQLLIRRKDRQKVTDHYQVFQRIKNQILGPEVEAIELYPAASREYDTSNTYSLWCSPEPFPIGYPAGLKKTELSG
jgi:hypothetical protein